MNKLFKSILFLLAATALTFSCAKEVNDPSEQEVINGSEQASPAEEPVFGEKVSITVSMPDDLTKISFSQDDQDADGPIHVAWEDGDKIRIANQENQTKFSDFEIESGVGEKTATFTGTIDFNGPYMITYGDDNGLVAEQNQSADGDTGHLKRILVLKNVNTYENVVFSSDWATANGGGSFKENGVIRLRAKLPAGAAALVKSVTFEISSSTVHESIKVNIATPGDAGDDGIIVVYASLPGGALEFPSDARLEVFFETSVHDYSRTLDSSDLRSMQFLPGKVNSFKLNCDTPGTNVQLRDFAGGIGEDGDPWLIATPKQLMRVDSNMENGTTKYFKLIDDIDMDGEEWTCINPATPYKPIDFDGNSHTISNLSNSMFYVFCKGSIKNLTLDHCTASNGTQRGIFTQYVQGNGAHTITNVDVTNSTVEVGNGSMGGLIGRINNPGSGTTTATITDCDVTNTSVTGKSTGTGGLIGSVESVVTVNNCNVKGTNVTGNNNAVAVGGLVGVVTTASSFETCSYDQNGETTATITGPSKTGEAATGTSSYGPGNAYIGGIAGEVSGAATFDDCNVKNATITVTTPTTNTSYWKNVGGAFGYIHNADAAIGGTKACSVKDVTITSYHFPGGFVSALDGGTIKSCTVEGLTISGQNFVGGFVGIVNTGTIDSCTVEGNTVQSANSTVGGFAGYIYGSAMLTSNSTSLQLGNSEHKMATNIGGFAGQVVASANISQCTASGNIYASSGSGGGFAGNVSAGSFDSCTAEGNVTSDGNQVGGFAGNVVGNSSFTSCHTTGSVTGGTNVGGFLGKTTAATISKCSASGNVSGVKYVGGIVGIVSPGDDITISISECYYSTGTIYASDTYVGGLVGITYQGSDTGKLDVQNCYVSGNVSSSNQWAGGILGSHYKGLAVLNNCYVTGSVTGTFGLGGIVGYVNAAGLEVTRCMPFNSGIHATNTDGNEHYSCGAIIGYGKGKKLVCNVSYRPDSLADNFNDCTGNSANIIEQHSFIATANTIPQRNGLTYGYYHHGRRTGYTLSNLVHSGAIGGDWSEEIWDWSGSRPVLVNNKETLE